MFRCVLVILIIFLSGSVAAEDLILKEDSLSPGRPYQQGPPPVGEKIDAVLQEVPPAPVKAGPSQAIHSEGFHEMIWGRHISTIQALQYLYTDTAAGLDIYVDEYAVPETPDDWENQPQYVFWDNKFLRVHLPVPDKKEWQALREQFLQRYGPGYELEGPKNVHRWETDEVVIVLRFDEGPQRGYLEAESKQLALARQESGISNGDRVYAALKHIDRDVKVRAINNLAFMQDQHAVDHLLPLLQDDDFIVRYNTAMALGEIRNERAVPALIQALEDGDRMVRSFVADALALIGDARAVKPLIEHIPDNESAVEALRKITGFDLGDKQEIWLRWWRADQEQQAQKVAL